MVQYQREVYQPSLEDTATYDLRDEEVEDERARLPLLIVIALLVLAAFSGVVWLAYNQGVERGRAGAPVIIAAPAGPLRTAPIDQAADNVPYTGLKVYGQPESPAQEADASALAPAPEGDTSVVESAEPAPVSPAPAKAAVETPRLNPPSAPPVIAKPAPVVKQTVPAPVTQTTVASVAKPAPSVAAKREQAVAKPAAVPAPAAGSAMLQIGAYPTQVLADGAWKSFKTRHAGIVNGLSSDVKQADLGAKGTWYRLRVGPFANKAAAETACDHLKSEGATCFPAAP